MKLLTFVSFFLYFSTSSIRCLKPVVNQNTILKARTPLVDKYTIVDKTRFVLQLLEDAQERYFLARPRRFGKTVFQRLLEATFDKHRQGEVILQGMDISTMNHKWEKFPVMYFDLSGDVLVALHKELTRFKKAENITTIPEECVYVYKNSEVKILPTVIQTFTELLCAVNEETVVLIDEYDDNILRYSEDPMKFHQSENLLSLLFAHIKSNARYIKLAFVTGVTRCSFLYMGSPGGDFFDISDSPRYATIAGITEEEMERYFQSEVVRLAASHNVTPDVIKDEIKKWYNSYSFSKEMKPVYNPKSVLRYFETGVAKVYWPKEGRPTFFWNQVIKRPEDFSDFRENQYSFLEQTGHIDAADPQTLMYEAGYYTIGNFKFGNEDGPYQLRFANLEVKKAFFSDFAAMTQARSSGDLKPYTEQMKAALKAEPEPDFNTFIAVADTAIRSWPFKFRFEEGYNIHLAALMVMADFNVKPQWNSELAVIDVLDLTSDTILLFELKLDRHGFTEAWKAARRSIDSFFFKQRNVLAAGISLTSKRNDTVVSGWIAELYSPNGTLLKTYKHQESEWYKKWRSSAYTKKP